MTNKTLSDIDKFHLIVMAYDSISQWTMDISPNLRQGLKQSTNLVNLNLRKMIKEFDKVLKQNTIEYGEDADAFRWYMEQLAIRSKEEQKRFAELIKPE